MSNEIINRSKTEITQTGQEVLKAFKKSLGVRTITREVSGIDKNGVQGYVKKTFTVLSSNERLNKGVAPAEIYEFVNSVKPDDKKQILKIIKAGTFEVVKAQQALNALEIAKDKTIKPADWNAAKKLDSPSLSTVKKYKGQEATVAVVYMMLFNFVRKFGKKNTLEESDLLELATDVVDDFYQLTIADLKCIFLSTLKSSKKIFSIDYNEVYTLIAENYKSKTDWATKQAIAEHESFKRPENATRKKTTPADVYKTQSVAEQVAMINAQYKEYKSPKNTK